MFVHVIHFLYAHISALEKENEIGAIEKLLINEAVVNLQVSL